MLQRQTLLRITTTMEAESWTAWRGELGGERYRSTRAGALLKPEVKNLLGTDIDSMRGSTFTPR